LLSGYPPLARIEERAPDHVVGRLASGVRVRVRVAPASRLGLAMVEETGPAAHLEELQARARDRGLPWDSIPAPDEQALYAALELAVVPAEARALSPALTAPHIGALIAASDIQGMVHCHT